MEGIALGILINLFVYMIPVFCFFTTLYFGFKAIKNRAEEIKLNKSRYLAIISACIFLFLAFVWPANFQMFMQNLELFKTVYYAQITLAPISILLLAVWLKKSMAIVPLQTF